MNKPSQKEKVLAHLMIYGSISSWEAIRDLRITRLAAIIAFLEEDGVQIQHTPKHDGEKRWTEYSLIHKGQPVLF